jgi:hypothetical protein
MKTPEPFPLGQAIGLSEAARLVRGRGGRPACVETLRRWANPKRGCRPAGKCGPKLVLKTHKLNNEILTLPQWVREFEQDRAADGERGQS